MIQQCCQPNRGNHRLLSQRLATITHKQLFAIFHTTFDSSLLTYVGSRSVHSIIRLLTDQIIQTDLAINHSPAPLASSMNLCISLNVPD